MKTKEVEKVESIKTFKGKTYTFNGYDVNDNGVFNSNGTLITSQIIYPTRKFNDVENDTEKLELYFKSFNKWKSITVDSDILANKNKIVNLSKYGMEVNSGNALGVVKFISDTVNYNSNVIELVDTVNRVGWYNDTFIPYSNDIEFSGDMNFKEMFNAVKEPSGEFEEWIKIAKKSRENLIVRVLTDISFSSVLLEKTNSLPYVALLWGGTGTRKNC